MQLKDQNKRLFGNITGFLWLFLFFSGTLMGQTDTLANKKAPASLPLKILPLVIFADVTTNAKVLRQNLPSSTENLSTLLANQSTLHIRNYHAGGVGSASYRGHSAAQIQVQWQGFSLNSPMHGQSDLSLIDIPFNGNTRIQNSTESVTTGAGGLGGKINLRFNKTSFEEKRTSLQILQNIGSFGNFYSALKVHYYHPKFNSITTLSNRIAKNNYPYQWNGQKLRLQHANLNQQSIQQAFYVKLKKQQVLSTNLWLYRADRNVPDIAGAIDTFNTHHQLDKGIRANINYEKDSKKLGKISFHSAYFNEFIEYDNDPSSFESVKNRIHYRYFGQRFELHIRSYNELLWANSQNYENPPHRRQFGVSTKLIYRHKPWTIKGLLLKESTNDFKNLPLLPTFSIKYEKSRWNINYNVGKNYRYPTFNELYWAQGGNTTLVPESGWSQEVKMNIYSSKFKINLTTYYGNIDNWIQWTPAATGYWSAQNLKKVRKQGIETTILYKLGSRFHFHCLYSYTQAKNQDTTNPLDQSLGKQLIYVPLHQGNFSLQYKDQDDRFQCELTQRIVSQRFVTSDNSQSLPMYTLTNLSAAYTFYPKKQEITTILQFNNIFNTQYQTIAQRPMMGRNYNVRVVYVLPAL